MNIELLRKKREHLGYSHREMASLLGAKSSATYYNIETGKSEPTITQLKGISKILEIPVEKILT